MWQTAEEKSDFPLLQHADKRKWKTVFVRTVL